MTTVAGPRDAVSGADGFTRRQLLAGLGGGLAIAMGLPAVVRGQAMTGTFTGPNHGLSVEWDEAVWQLLFSSLDSPPDPFDWMTMGPVEVPPGAAPKSAEWTLFRTDYAPAPAASGEAQPDAYRQYLEDADSDESFTQLVDAWESTKAIGVLMVQRSYDYDPWIYHEYAQVSVPGHWRRTTIAIPEANIETAYLTTLFNAVTVDGGPPFVAAPLEQVIQSITDAVG